MRLLLLLNPRQRKRGRPQTFLQVQSILSMS